MKDLIKKSTIYIIMGFLPTAVNFVMVPLLTDYLSKEEYGLLSISTIFQGIIAIFLNIGLDSAFARYYFNFYKKKQLLHAYYSTVLLAILQFTVILFTILWFFGDPLLDLLFKNDRYHFSDYGIVTFVLALSTILHTVVLTYYRNEENLKMYGLMSVGVLMLTVAGVLTSVIGFKWGAYGSIWGRCLAFTVVVMIYLLWYFRNRRLVFHWKYLKSMLGYGLPFVPYLLILMMNSSLDQWMMDRKFSLELLGEYNFGVQLASLVSVFTYAVYNAVSPRLYKLLAENDPENDKEIRNLNHLFHLVVIFGIVGEMAVISPFTTFLIHNEAYHAVLDYMPLLILVWLPHLYYMLYVVPLMFHNRTRYLPLIMVISLAVGIGSNLLLIPVFGIIGVCMSAIIIKLVSFTSSIIIDRREGIYFPQHYNLVKNHMLAILIFTVMVGIYLCNKLTGQQYRVWINAIPLMVFLIYSAIVFRKELNIVLTLLLKRKKE